MVVEGLKVFVRFECDGVSRIETGFVKYSFPNSMPLN
jgi:hypothetical protein